MTDQIYDKLLDLLSKQLSIEKEKITLESNLATDLGADSLDTAELAMSIKDEFDFDLSDNAITQIKTVSDIYGFLSKNGRANVKNHG